MNRWGFVKIAVFGVVMFSLPVQLAAENTGGSSKPDFGPNVMIFDPSMEMSAIQSQISRIFNQQERNEFGHQRYAILFKPGQYDLDVRVGYYMQILGLGQMPDDVLIRGAVRSNTYRDTRSVLSNFWRSAENLAVIPTVENSNVWGVSQAAPLRRVHIKGNLQVHDGGYASGGFLADSKVDGEIQPGQQQQWLTRNTEMAKWGPDKGSWNFVFVGVNNTPLGSWPDAPYTIIDKTPIVREKPFLQIDDKGDYSVFVPALRYDCQGYSWADGPTDGESIPIDRFYIAHAGVDNASSINAALKTGKNLLLTPGIYHLEGPIIITDPDTVVLGIGLPSLVPENGTAALVCDDGDGIIIAGVVFDAAFKESPVLLQVGQEGASGDHSQNPIFLFDVFCRVGTAVVGNAKSCVIIHSNNVVGDHFWLWRADHGPSAIDGRPGWKFNQCANGLIVNGDDVTIYGLFNEHFQEYQTLWNGNGGRVFMYQSESPYDPPSQDAWQHDRINGYASYKVNKNVTTHEAYGLGFYCVIFSSESVRCHNGYELPVGLGIKMNNLLTLHLVGREITHVINGTGEAAKEGDRIQRILNYP